MAFTRLSATRGVLRLGDFSINTPALSLPTVLYSLPYLTRDIYDRVLDPSRTIFEVYFEDLLENMPVLRKLPMSFKKFVHLEGYPMMVGMREERYFKNAEELTHVNSDTHLSGVNHGGVIKWDVEKVAKEAQQIVKPEAMIAPVDHFVLPGNEKRRRRAAQRTEKYYGHLCGTAGLIKSLIYSKSMQITPSGTGLVAVSGVDRDGIVDMDAVSGEVAVYLRGSIDLGECIRLIQAGRLDIVDGTFVTQMSEKGWALQVLPGPIGPQSIQWIDLTSKEYEADTSPLCPGCPCPGCQFMKAYVHHLMAVHEMLGPAALTAHNLHQTLSILSSL